MRTTIITSTNSTTGYEIRIVNDDGIVETKPITEIVDDGKTLKLPENPSNRKYFSIKKVNEANGEIELTYKATVTLGTSTNSTKKLEDYLDESDRELYLALVEKAKKAKEEAAKKPKTEVEKARARYERALAELKRLEEAEA